MSKIYEALLRAEQERLANANQKPAEPAAPPTVAAEQTYATPVAASATAVEEMPVQPIRDFPAQDFQELHDFNGNPPVAAPAPIPVAAEPVYASRSVPSSAPIAPHAQLHAPFDPTSIRTTVWTPMLEKLPALEERGGAVEQFRSLRTRLFGFRDLNNLKSILVSSGLPREGKSFIAANLAISFARHKASRVLIIDGDMRRASLHDIFGAEKSPGLTNFLAGHASINDIMQRAAINDDGSPLFAGLGSLTFIGGGEEGDKAADLSGSGRFRQLIESCSPHFDWIIVDSSPVNLVTDGVNLASACDAVLMVARGGVTKFEAAQRALAELKSSKILGVVLNAVEIPPSMEGYYGYDGYDVLKSPAGHTTQ